MACSEPEPEPEPESQGVDLEADPPELLSELNLLSWDGEKIIYAENVHPYDMNTALFSDYATKDRAIFVPDGKVATYRDNEVIDFPVGTVMVKSFMLPADVREPTKDLDLVETRVLVRYEDEWVGLPYVWDHELGDAVLKVQGAARDVSFIGPNGETREVAYLVPQKNQCAECHEIKDDEGETFVTAIGPKARHLNRVGADGENQLERLVAAGILEGLPPLSEVASAWDERELEDKALEDMSVEEVDIAARDYLDINCAHCHNPRGVSGISSQLFLNWDNEDDFHLGVCKKPGSAGKGGEGRDYDIVPGDPDLSILIYRTETDDIGAMMPLLGRGTLHDSGIALLRRWVADMPADDCMTP
jgi:uncharacterized repeat protein (TIGR03806 family)